MLDIIEAKFYSIMWCEKVLIKFFDDARYHLSRVPKNQKINEKFFDDFIVSCDAKKYSLIFSKWITA